MKNCERVFFCCSAPCLARSAHALEKSRAWPRSLGVSAFPAGGRRAFLHAVTHR
nr:MAG TPA: hypothetical protein [Caudoviricetes sp.]